MADNGPPGYVNVGTQQTVNRGGIDGFFGGTEQMPVYTSEIYKDPKAEADRLKIQQQIAATGAMPVRQTEGTATQSAGSTIDQTQQSQFRDRQMQLGNALMAQANGQGPSVAGSQLQQSTDMNLQAALAQAASSRGGNLGAAQYQLGNARANIQQQAAQQLAQTRIQEQMAARAQLGDVLNSGRGADIGLATNQAQLGQQNNQFNAGQTNDMSKFVNGSNLQAGIAQDQFKQEQIKQLMLAGLTYDQALAQSQIQQQQFNIGEINKGIATGRGISSNNAASGAQTAGSIMAGIGAAAGAVASVASDQNLKTDISDADNMTAEFLDALAAKHYSYKNEKYGKGPRLGIMAQDAEKSAFGKALVTDTSEGKMLDVNKTLSAALASVAHLNKRIRKLES